MNIPNIRFPEFTNEWTSTTIGAEFNLSSGSTPRTGTDEYFKDGTIYWINSGELEDKYLFSTSTQITDLAKAENHLQLYQPGTLIIAIYGLEAAGVRGKASILKKPCTISQACMALESKGNVLPEFMYYVYKKNANILGIKYAQGTKQQNLSTALVSNFKINYPSIEEQQRIVDLLSYIDQCIDLSKKDYAEWVKKYETVSNKLFNQKVRFKDKNGTPFSKWEIVNLGSLIKEVSEKTSDNDPDNLLSSTKGGLYRYNEYFNDHRKQDTTGYKIITKNQMVFSPQNLWMGNINFNTEYEYGLLSPSYKIYELNAKCDFDFMSYYLRTPHMLYQYTISSEQGASVVRRNLNLELFEAIRIDLPCLEEQKKIALTLKKFEHVLKIKKDKTEYWEALKRTLINNMIK